MGETIINAALTIGNELKQASASYVFDRAEVIYDMVIQAEDMIKTRKAFVDTEKPLIN